VVSEGQRFQWCSAKWCEGAEPRLNNSTLKRADFGCLDPNINMWVEMFRVSRWFGEMVDWRRPLGSWV